MKNARRRSERFAGLALALVSLISVMSPRVHCRNEADLNHIDGVAMTSTPVLPNAGASTSARVKNDYGNLPLSFEANQGQAPAQVKFISRGSGYNLFLTSTEASIALQAADNNDSKSKTTLVRMKLEGASRISKAEGLDENAARSNYFIGGDEKKWRTNIATYSKVRYEAVYPGIDLVYYGKSQQIEYDFIVAPGASPNRIAIDFRGADRVVLDDKGDLVLRTSAGELRQRKPVAYQEVNGVRKQLAARYQMKGKHKVGFSVASYDRRKPLIIDPVLSYSTMFYHLRAVAVDAAGNAYVAGMTYVTDVSDFPTTPGAVQPRSNGKLDMFISKLSADGTKLIYSTFLGGSNDIYAPTGPEEVFDIAVDNAGNAYLTGQAVSPDFPITPGAFQPKLKSEIDAFVTKLNATGTSLMYSTYLGGNGNDIGKAIAVDSSGNAYVAGSTNQDFPTTPGSFQPSGPANSLFANAGRGFVSKLNPTGTALIYSTYILMIPIEDIAVDASGAAYITGTTNSTSALVTATPGAYQSEVAGFMDVVVAKLTPDGSGLAYLTFLGGKNMEAAYGIAVDESGDAYVTGTTTSGDFPTVNAVVGRRGASPVAKTTDGGSTWSVSEGLVAQTAKDLAIDPKTPSTLYAQTSDGLFKSIDSGRSWVSIRNNMRASIYGGKVVKVDPSQPATVYADTFGTLYKSTDGGNSWTMLIDIVDCMAIDPRDTAKLYVGCDEGILKSTDGGVSWVHVNQGLPRGENTWVVDLEINPDNPSAIYAATGDGIFKSSDGGTNWNATPVKVASNSIAIDPQTSTLYASTPAVNSISSFDEGGRGNPRKGRPNSLTGFSTSASILSSTDAGKSWTPIASFSASNIVIDPKTTPSTLYVCRGGLYKSTDGGANWDAVTTVGSAVYAVAIDPTNSSRLYAGGTTSEDVFVTELNPKGTAVLYSTFFGGLGRDVPSGIAVDSAGNFYVAGVTDSKDFPITSGAVQSVYNGGGDGFIVKFNNQGELSYSTYLGGGLIEWLNKMAVDPLGNVYVAGVTASVDFPTTNASLVPSRKSGFIAKIDGSKDTLPESLLITGASIDKKRLTIRGVGFKMGAQIMLNDEAQPTSNDPQSPAAILIGDKKVVKKIAPGQTVSIQVENPNGEKSNVYLLYRAYD
jgi:photosystem II stability/assembly factor-like uncharacterized protein